MTGDELRYRLQDAGWTVLSGRPSAGVTTATCRRDDTHAFVVVIDRADENALTDVIGRHPFAVTERLGTAVVRVHVRDGAAALAELAVIAGVAVSDAGLAAVSAAVTARGWTVDRSAERDHDGFGWELKAHRADEGLELDCDLLCHPSGPEVRDGSAVHPIGASASLRATLHSRALARELLHTLGC
ncbi:MAG: hypothetical protein H6735_12880 [Alphaproteobacteria bacterium]|nr:hypothetical protein [Alphaproteobacteria bacterium]